MTTKHRSPIVFAEQTPEIQRKTLQFHRDFYNATGMYKDEPTYKLCKCANLPAKTTKSELYIHSVEASHYPLIACQHCGVLMEREDSLEHAQAKCCPQTEGAIFLKAMDRRIALAQLKAESQKANEKGPISNIDSSAGMSNLPNF